MNGKTDANLSQLSAENKACRNGRLYVYSRYSAVFGRKARETHLSAANDLAGNGKTIRAANLRQQMTALSMNEGCFAMPNVSDARSDSVTQARDGAMFDALKIIIPYGRANAQLHFAYGKGEGDVTLCRRDCFGWSIVRPFATSDLEDPYSCKACVRAAA